MRDPKTHSRALRAALQVARGNRTQAASVVTGVVMLTGCGGDATGDDLPQDDVSTLDSDAQTAGDAVSALVDAMDAAADASMADDAHSATAETSGGDAGSPMEDTAAEDTTTTSDDTMVVTPDAADPSDAMSGDTADSDEAPCVDMCWQPNGDTCTTHVDCNQPEVLGTCLDSGEPCSPGEAPCADGDVCEGYVPPITVYVDSSGEVPPFASDLKCIDGFCHEGDAISPAAQACCGWGPEGETLPWCEGLEAPMPGCTPWGPPAPPSFDGQPLAERMRRWLS